MIIDEFQKTKEDVKKVLHEVLEHQTFTLAKANINSKFPANISLLAAANPVFGKWNMKKSIEVNVNLPASLYSRFDLIWTIIDNKNNNEDLKLAKEIIRIHNNEKICSENKTINPKQLMKYINFVKDRDVYLNDVSYYFIF